ncbi:hypothetical protein BH10ACT9_BH10ACT9_46160 [soil metagenome]
MAADELDLLLRDRLNLGRAEVIAALKSLPARRPPAAALTAVQALLLDSAGFTEDPAAYSDNAVDVIVRIARLLSTAFSAADVASGLGIDDVQLRARRRARTAWAIDGDGTWVYPRMQFEVVDDNRCGQALQQVRGLDQILPALPTDVHPLAVAGFLLTPQSELNVDGGPRTVREWLRGGGAVADVLRLVEIGDWAPR